MSNFVQSIEHVINTKSFSMINPLFQETLSKFDIKYLNEDNYFDETKRKPNIIVVDFFSEKMNDSDNGYFILCYDYSIRIINYFDHSIICNLFSQFQKAKIYFVTEYCENILRNLNPNFEKYLINNNDCILNNGEITEFSKSLKKNQEKQNQKINKEWKIIQPCIVGYLIKKSCYNGVPKFENFDFNDLKNQNKFINLRNFNTNSSYVSLYYCVKEEKLMIVKKPNKNDLQWDILLQRESYNYKKLPHTMLPEYIGFYKDEKNTSNQFLLIEYINGHTLDKYDMSNLSENEIFNIIFELMIIIHYIHINKCVYRDLKPNNIIIDEYNLVRLIDLNRVRSLNENLNEEPSTVLFSKYTAPEINKFCLFSDKSDIFSLGMVISDCFEKHITSEFKSKINLMCQICQNDDENKRPTISQLIRYYYINILAKMQRTTDIHSLLVRIFEENFKNKSLVDPDGHLTIGLIYLEGFYVPQNPAKAFFSLIIHQIKTMYYLKLI